MKTLLLVIVLLLGCRWAGSQEWHILGLDYKNQIWPGNAIAPSFAMDGQGNLYIGFLEDKETHTVIVSKYENGQWHSVGVEGFSKEWSAASIAVSPDGIVYTLGGIAGALVSRFNGMSWEAAGTSDHHVLGMDLAITVDGTPTLAAIDRDQANKATVLKLSGDTWQTVGQAGFTQTPVDTISIEIAPDGTPYVTCMVNSGGYRGTVMRFTDGAWQAVGQAGIRRGAYNPSLAISGDGTPYLAYSDSMNHYKATVVKLEGDDWQPVGNEGFSAGFAAPDIAVDKQGTPYVAYADSTIGGKMIVSKFNGSSWETAGNAGFSGFEATNPAILISPAGTPYVAYADRVISAGDTLFKAKVSYLDDATWRTAGQVSMGKGGLAVTPGGIPYVAYHYDNHTTSSFERTHKTSVISYNGCSWETMGRADFFTGTNNIVLAAGSDGTPYIAYNDSAHDYKLTVARFDGSDWETVGQAGFTDKTVAFDITVDKNGTPWVALNTSGKYPELQVLRFNGSEWEKVGEPGYTWYGTPSIVTNNEGIPYVLNSSQPQGNNLIVRKWEDANWVMVGDPPVEDMPVMPELLAFDSEGRPMIGYQEADNLHIKIYDQGQWTSLSTVALEGKYAMEVFADQDGNLYAAALDRDRMIFSVYQYDNDHWEKVGDEDFAPGGSGMVLMDADTNGRLYLIYENQGIQAYLYEQDCTNPTDGGIIAQSQSGCEAFGPNLIRSQLPATGYKGNLEYKWQSSTTGVSSDFMDIPHNAESYDPGILTQTTWLRRLARVNCMTDWKEAAESNVVKMIVAQLPVFNCPANDTLFNDMGTMVARRSYNALPDGIPDTLAVYFIDGKTATFPYDFPLGTSTVEVKASGSCTDRVACSFTVTVRKVTGIDEWNAGKLNLEVYPNPFTSEMAIEIKNPSLEEVTVEIFSISGQKIKTLAKALKGAKISLQWRGDNDKGKQVPRGMYLLKMNRKTRKVVREGR